MQKDSGNKGGYHKLRCERMRAGLTQKDMAKALGLSSSNAYCQKESGARRFSVEEAMRIARELDTSVEDLFLQGTTRPDELFPADDAWGR